MLRKRQRRTLPLLPPKQFVERAGLAGPVGGLAGCSTDRTHGIDLRIRMRGLRVVERLLPVRPQAFEQAPEERFVSRQACCPVSVSFGP